MSDQLCIGTDNGLMTDDLPAIEWSPPFTMDFVAHLAGGCYPDDVTPALLRAVRTDRDGARMLYALALVQLELVLLRCGHGLTEPVVTPNATSAQHRRNRQSPRDGGWDR
jgi:hypothetical protein